MRVGAICRDSTGSNATGWGAAATMAVLRSGYIDKTL